MRHQGHIHIRLGRGDSQPTCLGRLVVFFLKFYLPLPCGHIPGVDAVGVSGNRVRLVVVRSVPFFLCAAVSHFIQGHGNAFQHVRGHRFTHIARGIQPGGHVETQAVGAVAAIAPIAISAIFLAVLFLIVFAFSIGQLDLLHQILKVPVDLLEPAVHIFLGVQIQLQHILRCIRDHAGDNIGVKLYETGGDANYHIHAASAKLYAVLFAQLHHKPLKAL